MGSHDVSRTLVAALSEPATYGGTVDTVQVVETHISWVFLTGEYAYKVKKPLRLPFLDFSTLEARHRYCDEELRLNRRLAPEIYLDVVPIGGTADAPRIGATPAIEYAVKMIEFPASARLDRVIAEGRLSDAAIETFAERLASFHRSLEPASRTSDFGSAAAVRGVVVENLEQAVGAGAIASDAAEALRSWLRAEGARVDPVLAARRQAGAIREGHGDLHLQNLIDWNGEVVAFDALEFDAALRYVDTIDEVAFLTMDLLAHSRPDFAFRFLNRYLEVSGDYPALTLLRYYMIHRALVRAKVRALAAGSSAPSAASEAASMYVGLAQELCSVSRPTLAVTRGFSGSGKTTWTDALLGALPAIRLRSDVLRKHQAGLAELESSGSPVGGGLYDSAGNARAYDALAAAARDLLQAGYHVIVDATFLRRADRERFAGIAKDVDANFRILDFVAETGTLRARITARNAASSDPSEATLEVLDWQLERADPLDSDELEATIRIDTETESPSSIDEAFVARVLEPADVPTRARDWHRA